MKSFTIHNIVVIIVLLATNSECGEPKAGLEMFSLDKLIEYNSLVDCFTTIKEDFSACNRDAQRRGELVLKYIDENSDFGVMLKCCGTWMVRDCWVKAAKDRCHDQSVEQLHALPVKFMPAIGQLCHNYQPGTVYCYVPHIVVASFVGLVLLVVFGVVLAVALIVFRRRRRRRLSKVEVNSEHSNNNDCASI